MAESAEEGLILFLSRKTDFDLIITDIVMPGLTGVEMIQVINGKAAQIPVIFISSFENLLLNAACRGFPNFAGTLLKPFRLDEFKTVIAATRAA
jgi:YesN/AraC family two-component response regulator